MTATTADPTGATRRIGRLIQQQAFRLFWIGGTISELGNRMANMAVPLLAVTTLHASTFTVGLLTAVAFIPWLLVSLPAGALLDRVGRRGVMITCDVTAALLFASVPVAAWTGTLTIAQVLAVALLAGTAAVFSQTAYQAYLPDLLPPGDLTVGNALVETSANAAALGGPGLGGYVVQALGAASSLLFNAFSFLVSAACLARTAPQAQARAAQPDRPGGSFRKDIGNGVRFVFRDGFLRPMTIWAAVTNFGLAGYDALVVVFLVRVVHAGAGLIGLLLASSGAGAIAGSLAAAWVTARLGTARGFLLTVFLAQPLILLIPLAGNGPRLAFFVAGSFCSSAGIALSNVIVVTFRQAYPPPGLRARTTASTWFLLNGVYLPGALLGGALGAWAGVRNAIWIMLATTALANASLLSRTLRQHRDLPQQADPAAVPC